MKSALWAALLASHLVSADWQFRSRPDLSAPRLNITVSADSAAVESGLIFVAPYHGNAEGSSGPLQPGAYIFRDDGELIWSGVGHFGGWIANFRPDMWQGKPVLRAFEGLLDAVHGRMYGRHSLLNNRYEAIKSVRPAAHRLVSCHEFRVLDNGNVLVETPVAIPTNLSRWGGHDDQNWIVSSGFQEINIETGELVFEWYSFDHVDPKYSALPLTQSGPLNAHNSNDAWNYFHINSVDKDDNGDYLISGRHYNAIFKIDGKTGNIIWQLGGSHGSNFSIPDNIYFAFQHDARFVSRSSTSNSEVISFFDNAAHSERGREISSFSRARIVRLDHLTGEAIEVHTYPAPDNLVAHSQGNAQVLPSANVFVNWGEAGAITEFAENGKVLFHAYLDSDPVGRFVQSYRGFRFNWTGIPSEEPAIVALRSNGSQGAGLSIYVSWNGDTETGAWRFYHERSLDNASSRRLLGEAKRTSFETVFHLDLSLVHNQGAGGGFSAEAIDSQGNVLVRTRTTLGQADIWHPSAVAKPLEGLYKQSL